jgi:hypothetical protein
MIPDQARQALTPAQVETIEVNPLYPAGLSGIDLNVITGEVVVRFGDEVRFTVTPAGKVKPRPRGILADQVGEIEMRIEELQRTVDSLADMVHMLMTPDQRMRCHQRRRR